MGFPGEESLVFDFSPSQGAARALSAKTAETMRIATAGQGESCKARLQAEVKRQAVQWIDGPGSDGVGNKDLGVKPGQDESVGQRGAPQLDVQELELKQQPGSQERKEENTREAPPDPEDET